MGAVFFQEAEPAAAIAKRDQIFAEQTDPHRRAVGFGKFFG